MRCPRCGAPLSFSPDELITFCKYCGMPVLVRGISEMDKVFAVSSPQRSKIEREFSSICREDPDLQGKNVNILSVRGVYVPVFLGEVRYRGYVIMEVQRDKNTEYVTHHIEGDGLLAVGARRGLPTGMTKVLLKRIVEKKPPLIPLKSQTFSFPEEVKIFGPEYDFRSIDDVFKDETYELVKDLAFKKLPGSVHEICIEVVVGEKKLVLVPVWEVKYSLEGQTYTAYFDWSGRCFWREEPMRLSYRIGAGVALVGTSYLLSLMAEKDLIAAIVTCLIYGVVVKLLNKFILGRARVEKG